MAQTLPSTEHAEVERASVSLSEAYRACQEIVRRHYENFPVVSRLLTPSRRNALAAIYAFARNADDIADASAPSRERIEALDQIERALLSALEGSPTGHLFTALADSVERHRLPAEPFLDLLAAFRQDARDETFGTWDDLLAYCRGSANTVGHLVLATHGIDDPNTLRESDAICTALQLTNFWQDLGRDFERGRIFLPLEDLRRFGLGREDFTLPHNRGHLTQLIVHECHATSDLFERGRGIVRRVPFALSLQLRATIAGGREVLRRVEQSGWRVLGQRPTLGRGAHARILLRLLLGLDG